jgi:hypothetical protein
VKLYRNSSPLPSSETRAFRQRVRHVVQSAFNGQRIVTEIIYYARLCNAVLAEFEVSLPGPTLQVACVTSQRVIAMLLRRALLALADHFPQ